MHPVPRVTEKVQTWSARLSHHTTIMKPGVVAFGFYDPSRLFHWFQAKPT